MTAETAEFLTPAQLAQRWRGVVTTGTLANWRSKGVGPSFTKLRGRVLYPLQAILSWEKSNLRHAASDGEEVGEAA
jgi:hypothetical protein